MKVRLTCITTLLYAASAVASPELNQVYPEIEEQAHQISSLHLDEASWRYAIDPYGSHADIGSRLVSDDQVRIKFTRVPRVDAKRNSWVELIYDLPDATLEGVNIVRLNYKSSSKLVVKLSQQDYGGDGDKSYAHYQYLLPSTGAWQTMTFKIDDFKRPNWTPISSEDLGIIKPNISALYLVPDLTDKVGGEATIQVRSIELLP